MVDPERKEDELEGGYWHIKDIDEATYPREVFYTKFHLMRKI